VVVVRLVIAALTLGGLSLTGVALGQGSKEEGRTSTKSGLQVSGRQLKPYGKLTGLGNFPAGGAMTPNGRFVWTVQAGRGANDIRILDVNPRIRCRSGRAGRQCRLRRQKRTGRLIQLIPMPGATGGIAISSDGRRAYVSGSRESGAREFRVGEEVPGQEGDVIHAFNVDPRTGRATRDGVIPVPPPSDAPIVQDFPPTSLERTSWPRDLAISPDGKRLLAALNLADRAAVIDTESRSVRYVETGSYPYGAAITRDGKLGLVSNEATGTVSVIELASARKIKDIRVGPNLSHPEGIAVNPVADRAYVAVTHQDLVAVIDTRSLEVIRTLSVERPEGLGTAPVAVTVTRDGTRLIVADSGEDALAVFRLPERGANASSSPIARTAEQVLQHEGRRGADQAETAREEAAEIYGEEVEEEIEEEKLRRPVAAASQNYELIGKIPTASYPTWAGAVSRRGKLVWIAAEGLGSGPNTYAPGEAPFRDPGSATSEASEAQLFKYLPAHTFGKAGTGSFPDDGRLRRLTPRAARQLRPTNTQEPPAGTPIRPPGPGQKIEHVFYIVRENRTYDQILGADPRGDGDPKLELFGERVTPNAHALARRFPLLDHVYANSEASIDGHFWTSAAAVSDYVSKNWHQNYGGRGRPYDFGVYAVTWPAAGFLFDQAEKQGIEYFNWGEAIAGVVEELPDKDKGVAEIQRAASKQDNSDLNVPATPTGCFPNVASSGGIDEVLSLGPAPDVEVYDSSLPPGAPPLSLSRFDCFRARFNLMLALNDVPAFNYITLPNDHTAGTSPGRRTPNAMLAENDWALGQVVDLISHSPIWSKSLIMVIEDDSQDGADHVDAHRIPAFAISPYAKRGAVVHTRYDFLSFIRTLEIITGIQPLNLFDSVAVPLYDALGPEPSNSEAYDAILPGVNLTERNTGASPNAQLSSRLPLGFTDRTPQRILDRILWQYVHGLDSEPPPPGPNASGLDEARWRRGGAFTQREAEEALREELEEARENLRQTEERASRARRSSRR
jgi:DNA-binding beta-propeller fold protein YncE